ncbi:DNA polymerase alpha/epsilon subunit B-domain-containing protein [Amylocystis lapponica]|nr:DNA polymerase alpha/epsilon subunit B-domain-containing protein [Amylocystis lapponica]
MSAADPLPVPSIPLARPAISVLPSSRKTPSFQIVAADKSYKHQYANIYYARLQVLRPFVEHRARRQWKEIAGDPTFVPRVLDVVKGQLCFIIGTVYMDMPLKPNVLEDLARDHSIPAPPPRVKFYSADDVVTLEDESGRICLAGERLRDAQLVTGVILGALGIENASGDFEVVDICFAGLAPQASLATSESENDDSMDVDGSTRPSDTDEWVALVSGLEVGATSPADAQIQMLVEYLTGEAGGPHDQSEAARISRLIIAGNSLAPVVSANGGVKEETDRKPRRYGYDTTHFSPHPTLSLSAHLLDIARAMPVHLLPGASDPSGTILPQQPLPRAMFGAAAAFASFSCETNPPAASTSVSAAHARTLLVHAGQAVDDMYKYVASPPATRLGLAAATLRWRHTAPTAPDTLWCHPFFGADPFVLAETPDVYVVGNQPRFATRVVSERGEGGERRCRVVLVPGFRETGVLVLLNLRTLAVRTVQFAVQGMSAGGGAET